MKIDADRLDLNFVEKVEGRLPKSTPVVPADYPVQARAFVRRQEATPAVA